GPPVDPPFRRRTGHFANCQPSQAWEIPSLSAGRLPPDRREGARELWPPLGRQELWQEQAAAEHLWKREHPQRRQEPRLPTPSVPSPSTISGPASLPLCPPTSPPAFLAA